MNHRLCWILLLAVAACGGSTPPPETATTDAPADDAASDPADGATSADQASLAARRDGFLRDCASSLPDAGEYCQCSWELLASLLTEKEIVSDEADRAKLDAFKQQVGPTCGSKIPEAVVEKSFFQGCVSGKEGMDDYCNCTYGVLRKHLSAADLAMPGNERSPKFLEAKEAAVGQCRDKIREDAVKKGFMYGCSKDDPKIQPFCSCAWKELRKQASAADIVTGKADLDAAQPLIETSCGKLRPPK
jgi:hypothetical protein